MKPTAHAALYNWGVALSDLARAVKAASAAEAASCLHLASQKYAASLKANPSNPQALNNWGLVLQVGCEVPRLFGGLAVCRLVWLQLAGGCLGVVRFLV